MPELLFSGARLKIERAKKHINDLDLIQREFIERKSHEVFIVLDVHGGDDLLKVKALARLPDSFVLTLGDAIHTLRTSLDYVVNDIEFLHTGKRTTFTKFPAYQTRDSLINAVNGGLKQKAPEQVINCIVDTIQPYKGGYGEFIFSLHDLDIEDKHRLLITKVEFNFVNGISIEDDTGIETPIDTWLVVDEKIAAHPIRGNRNAKVKNQGQASYKMLFSNNLPFALLPVVPTLHDLVKLVSAVIDEIELVFRLSQLGI